MIADNRRTRAHTDWPLILLVAGLSLFGVIAVCVATYSIDSTAESLLAHILESDSARRQCFFLLLAPVIVTVLMNIPYHLFKRFTTLLYFVATFLVAFTWISNRAEGVKAWTDIIWGMTIQPSEFIKLAMILVLAQDLSKEESPLSTGKDFAKLMGRVALPAAIILASGETGSLIVIVFFCAVMMFFSNVNMKLLLTLAAIVALALIALYAGMIALDIDDYRLRRILAFFNPSMSPQGDAYQMLQSQIAIGSGGLLGLGLGNSQQKFLYLPETENDYVFPIVVEELGFVGGALVLVLFAALILRGYWLALHARDKFGSLLIVGIITLLATQVFLNIGVVTNLIPNTGISLPFFSYGGTALWINLAEMGIVLAVSRQIPAPKKD